MNRRNEAGSDGAMVEDEEAAQYLESAGQKFAEPEEDEPAEAFAALKQYLKLGPSRNLEQLRGATSGRSEELAQMAEEFQWEERANAWDQAILARKRAVLGALLPGSDLRWQSRLETWRQVQWTLAESLLGTAKEAMSRLAAPDKLPDLIKLLECASRLGRESCETERLTPPKDETVNRPIQGNFESMVKRIYGSKKESMGD